MKRLVFIFLCIASNLQAQYQTSNLKFLWNGNFEISGSDTLLVDSITGTGNANFKLINCDFSIDLGYIPSQSLSYIIAYDDTMRVNSFFWNFNLADTLFYRYDSATYNNSAKKFIGRRLTKIGNYTTATTDNNHFFGSLEFSDNVTKLGIGKDYEYLKAALTAASGDTLLIFSGEYDTTNYHFNVEAGTICYGVGNSKIKVRGTSAQYIAFYNYANSEMHNLKLVCDSVRLSRTYLDVLFENNDIYLDSLIFGLRSDDNLTLSNNVIESTIINRNLFTQNKDSLILIDNLWDIDLNDNFFSLQTVDLDVNYDINGDKFIRADDGGFISWNGYELTINNIDYYQHYNDNTVITASNAENVGDNIITINNSVFKIDTIADGRGFYIRTDTVRTYFNFLNDSIIFSKGEGSFINFCFGGININGCYIDMWKSSLSIQDPDSICIIENNSFLCRHITAILGGSIISCTGDTFAKGATNVPVFIRNNRVLSNTFFAESPYYFHACIFIDNLNNAKIYDNYTYGGGIGGIVYKTENMTSEGAYIQGNVISHVFGETSAAGILVKGLKNLYVGNNTIYACHDGILITKGDDGQNFRNGTLVNNIIYNTYVPFYFLSNYNIPTQDLNNFVSNNTVYTDTINSDTLVFLNESTETLIDTTEIDLMNSYFPGTQNTYENPLFQDISKDAYWLSPYSPCLYSGIKTNYNFTGILKKEHWPEPETIQYNGTIRSRGAYYGLPIFIMKNGKYLQRDNKYVIY